MPKAKRAPKKAVKKVAKRGRISGPGISPAFYYEYVTSTVSVRAQETILVRVVNDSAAVRHTRVIMYQNSGIGALVAVDSGVVSIAPTWAWYVSFPVTSPGEYWVRIRATSDVLIPAALFERFQGGIWVPFQYYRPGDFAVFRLIPPPRQRLW